MKWDHSLIDTLEWGNQISHKEDKIKNSGSYRI